jgi:putative ABC transport system permease protein
VSQTDLIVGARSSPLNIVLYTLFHIGDATNNIHMETYEELAKHPAVKWSIPISLGDSHRGFRVVATNTNFYEHFQFRGDRYLDLNSGKIAKNVFDVVLGADVAEKLNYKLGESIILSHGLSGLAGSLAQHSDKPFHVVGILKKTATPLDRALFITLEGMEAIHMKGPMASKASNENSGVFKPEDIKVKQITSILITLKSRAAVLHMQRMLQNYEAEPLEAAIPGFELSKLWQVLSVFEKTLSSMTLAIFIVGLLGMLSTLFSALEQRRREIAILRALGARSMNIFSILMLESYVLVGLAMIGGFVFYNLFFLLCGPLLEKTYGLSLSYFPFEFRHFYVVGGVLVMATLAALIPAVIAYLRSIHTSLSA